MRKSIGRYLLAILKMRGANSAELCAELSVPLPVLSGVEVRSSHAALSPITSGKLHFEYAQHIAPDANGSTFDISINACEPVEKQTSL